MKEPKIKGRRTPNTKEEKQGGKALERLHQFEQERGLKPTVLGSTTAKRTNVANEKGQDPRKPG